MSSIHLEKSVGLSRKYFGEGSTLYGGKIYVLTWREFEVLVYDKHLKYLNTLTYPAELKQGWDLAHSPNYLYVTNGSNKIYKVEPHEFTVISSVEVFDENNVALSKLNEIEYVDGFIYANVWF